MSKQPPQKTGAEAFSSQSLRQLPHVVLLGRPNVGKSTLYNRLLRARKAVVSDLPGTTRDRLEQVFKLKDFPPFLLIDMAGIETVLKDDAEISQQMQMQVQTAINQADLILFIVEAKSGLTIGDQIVAKLLRRSDKPAILVINKCDNSKDELQALDFAQLGLEPEVKVSSLHAKGITPLLDLIKAKISCLQPKAGQEQTTVQATDQRELAVSILGRPNVGKSTLLNLLAKSNRVVVSAVPGTTRDAVDELIPAEAVFKNTFTKWQTVRLIDTAGIRKPGQIEPGVEKWSIIRSLDSIERSEVVLLVINGEEGLTHQDLQIAQKIVEVGRPLILVINKWDTILSKKEIIYSTEEELDQQASFMQGLINKAPFLHFVPVIFISALKSWNTEHLGKLILKCYNAWSNEVDAVKLKEIVHFVQTQPRLKRVSAITMTHSQPPTFQVEVDGKELLHFSAVRQIDNLIREIGEIGPTPIKIWTKPKFTKVTSPKK